jgi:limonene-1,2-epoxide hydrolase
MISPGQPEEKGGERLRLDIDTVAALWSKTYNTEGKPDWSHIYPYYHQDVVFQDTIQRIEGKAEFIALCERLTARCKSLHMDIHRVAQSGNSFFLEWTMTMSFKKFPNTPMYGTTRLTLDGEGLIVEQRDYYDLWGDIFNGIPRFRGPYRKFMRKRFG